MESTKAPTPLVMRLSVKTDAASQSFPAYNGNRHASEETSLLGSGRPPLLTSFALHATKPVCRSPSMRSDQIHRALAQE